MTTRRRSEVARSASVAEDEESQMGVAVIPVPSTSTPKGKTVYPEETSIPREAFTPRTSSSLECPCCKQQTTTQRGSRFSQSGSSVEVTEGTQDAGVNRDTVAENDIEDESDNDIEINPITFRITFHRHAIVVNLLRIILIIFLLPGVSLWLTFALCVTVNVGYSTFSLLSDYSSPKAIETLPFVVGFFFYLRALFAVTRSFIRTALRLAVRFWTASFGAGERDTWAGRVIDRWVVRWRPWAIRWVLWVREVPDELRCDCHEYAEDEKGAETDKPRTKHKPHCHLSLPTFNKINWDEMDPLSPLTKFYTRLERFKVAIFSFIIILILLIIPIILSFIDLWTAVGILSALTAFASFFLIVLTNLLARLIRIGRYIILFWNGQISEERRRAMYVASYGFVHKIRGANRVVVSAKGQQKRLERKYVLVDAACDHLMVEMFVVALASIVLSSMRVRLIVIVPCGIVFVCAFLVRFRWHLMPCYGSMHHLHRILDNPCPYDGSSSTPVYVLCAARTVYYFLGFGALVMLDTQRLSLQTDIPARWAGVVQPINVAPSILKGCIWLMLAIFLTRDLTFILPGSKSPKLRATIQTLTTLACITASVTMRTYFPLYTYGTALLVAVLSLDFRDAHIYLSINNQNKKPRIPNILRATRRAVTLFYIICAAGILSLCLGVYLNLRATTHTSSTTSSHPSPSKSSHICNPTFPFPTAAPLDMWAFSVLAVASYEDDPVGYVTPPLGRYNLTARKVEISGMSEAYWVHFNLTGGGVGEGGVQVVSVRGTANLDDMFQDLYLFATPALLRYSSYIGTFFILWPRRTLAEVVRIIFRLAANPSLTYFFAVEDYIHSLAVNLTSTYTTPPPIFVTGHSLGAALAALSAVSASSSSSPSSSTTSTPTLPPIVSAVFSSPALGSSYLAFGVGTTDEDQERFYTQVVNLYLEGDPVPVQDQQVGTSVMLPCGRDAWGVECHSIARIARRLGEVCGVGEIEGWDVEG
ncbi:hypothetical protein HDV00_011303 [Rhizophlyctis rosea]|nr:hypothetical protein HDV00_011303 [Rhizophlyctis rosea]